MLSFPQLIPAKEKQADKGGFQKKRHQALNGKRRSKNITNIMREIGPVHTELKFHRQAGGDA